MSLTVTSSGPSVSIESCKDVFAIQEEIADRIVDALEVTLSPRERRAIKQVATAVR